MDHGVLMEKKLAHLAVHQHAKHLEVFVAALRLNNHLSKALRMEMDKYQMLVGTRHHFFNNAKF